ncbi:hypothetical protein [Aliikangiella maris]|uniref:Uncharacterized protein n=2 Tax=Aliikangiella maris TaxID=3162458 RepID=A0ABV3ML66_9GAMM
MKRYYWWLLVGAITLSTHLQSAQLDKNDTSDARELNDNKSVDINFDSIAVFGIDSNPLGLSDELEFEDETFALAGFYSNSQLFDWVFWDISVEKAQYFDDARIDWFTYWADVKLAHDFSIKTVPFAFELGGKTQHFDETYVDTRTGRIAVYQEQSIADRFDRDVEAYYFQLSYPMSTRGHIGLTYSEQKNDYQDYAIDELDNLDNDEVTTQLSFVFYPAQFSEFYLNFSETKREYLMRQDRDLAGELIAETVLQFHDYITDIGFRYLPSERNQWQFGFSYTNRSSQGTQYYDSQRGQLFIEGEFNLADFHRLKTRLDYQTFFYDESLGQTMAYFEKDDIDRHGATLSIEYTLTLATLLDSHLSFYGRLSASQFESNDRRYAFERQQIMAGFRWYLK